MCGCVCYSGMVSREEGRSVVCVKFHANLSNLVLLTAGLCRQPSGCVTRTAMLGHHCYTVLEQALGHHCYTVLEQALGKTHRVSNRCEGIAVLHVIVTK